MASLATTTEGQKTWKREEGGRLQREPDAARVIQRLARRRRVKRGLAWDEIRNAVCSVNPEKTYFDELVSNRASNHDGLKKEGGKEQVSGLEQLLYTDPMVVLPENMELLTGNPRFLRGATSWMTPTMARDNSGVVKVKVDGRNIVQSPLFRMSRKADVPTFSKEFRFLVILYGPSGSGKSRLLLGTDALKKSSGASSQSFSCGSISSTSRLWKLCSKINGTAAGQPWLHIGTDNALTGVETGCWNRAIEEAGKYDLRFGGAKKEEAYRQAEAAQRVYAANMSKLAAGVDLKNEEGLREYHKKTSSLHTEMRAEVQGFRDLALDAAVFTGKNIVYETTGAKKETFARVLRSVYETSNCGNKYNYIVLLVTTLTEGSTLVDRVLARSITNIREQLSTQDQLLPTTSPNPYSADFLTTADNIFKFSQDLIGQCSREETVSTAQGGVQTKYLGNCLGFGPDMLYIFDSKSELPIEVPLSERSLYLYEHNTTSKPSTVNDSRGRAIIRKGLHKTVLEDRLRTARASTRAAYRRGTRVIWRETGRGTVEGPPRPLDDDQVGYGPDFLIPVKLDGNDSLFLVPSKELEPLFAGPERGGLLGDDWVRGQSENQGGSEKTPKFGGGFWKRVRQMKRATRKKKKEKSPTRKTRKLRHYKQT